MEIDCYSANAEDCWVSHPEEWQPLFVRWAAEHPEEAELHVWPQLGGRKVVGLTTGNRSAGRRLLVAVPHAHEPAGTAVAVDLAAQLFTGRHLDGTPTALPVEDILSHLLISLLPDTNSQGRSQSPERCWDGKVDNEQFLKIAFGKAADGSRFGRYPEWRASEHQPGLIGIEYEQVDDDLFVEPNTSRRSTHYRAVTALHAKFGYTHHLDMHQHEAAPAALLPAEYEELPEGDRREIMTWAEMIISAWTQIGADPRPDPYIPYKGRDRQLLFKAFWKDACPGMRRLTTEVRNNRDHKTGEPVTLPEQFAMAEAALMGTIRHLLG
ncbi:MAG TPA: hypothetical protein GXX29_07640 [Firmicutes bacterium]|nr:hypothetical protein [Bacillota bacterium]